MNLNEDSADQDPGDNKIETAPQNAARMLSAR